MSRQKHTEPHAVHDATHMKYERRSCVWFCFLTFPVSSYGYRGRDCRSNLYLLPTGETVYFIASVVVLFNVDEQLQRHYTGHTDDIKWYATLRYLHSRGVEKAFSCFHVFLFASLAVHPDKITIATGQVAGTSSDGKVSGCVSTSADWG